MAIVIDGVTPCAQPYNPVPSRDLLDRDGNNHAIQGAELVYQLSFGPMDVVDYTQWFNLATTGDHTVSIPRIDDMLPQIYTDAQVLITNMSYVHGMIESLQVEIRVYQAPA